MVFRAPLRSDFAKLIFSTMIRTLATVAVLAFTCTPSLHSAIAQAPDTTTHRQNRTSDAATVSGQGRGTVTLTEWPASLGSLLDEMGRNAPYLLPKVDSLALDYRYATTDSTSRWSFVLGWQAGNRVLYKGDILSRQSAPPDLRMVNVELRAQVDTAGEHAAEMIVAVDSMRLAPFPSIYSFEVTVRHGRVFLDASAEEAREMLRKGVTLDSLIVERMGFVTAAPSSTSEGPENREERRRRSRSDPSVYQSQTRIHIGWRVAPRPYFVDEQKGERTVRPREEAIGRTVAVHETRERTRTDGRAGEEGLATTKPRSRDDSEDEDDEDDTSLRGAALAVVAALGIMAYTGGTVGMYGHGETPIGIAAGYTHPNGGFQLQAAVNGSVISGETAQKLTVKGLGYYDSFSARLKPSIGLGVQIDPTASGDVRPNLSLGFATNIERLTLLGGFDVIQASPEMAIVYNFRDPVEDSSGESIDSK